MDTSPPDHFRETMELLGHHDQELCGLVTARWTIIPIENIAPDKWQSFEMNPESLRRAFDTVDDLIGVYHTHPGGTRGPSQADINSAPEGLRYFIAIPGELTEWRIDGISRVAHEVHHVSAEAGPEADQPAGEGKP